MCSSAPFTASAQRYRWLSCHALTSAIPGLSQLVLAPYRNLIPYKPRRRPDASATMQRLAFRRAVVPVSLRYNIPVVPPAGCSAAPKNRDRDSPGADKALISPWTMSIGHLLLYIYALCTFSAHYRITTLTRTPQVWGRLPCGARTALWIKHHKLPTFYSNHRHRITSFIN